MMTQVAENSGISGPFGQNGGGPQPDSPKTGPQEAMCAEKDASRLQECVSFGDRNSASFGRFEFYPHLINTSTFYLHINGSGTSDFLRVEGIGSAIMTNISDSAIDSEAKTQADRWKILCAIAQTLHDRPDLEFSVDDLVKAAQDAKSALPASALEQRQ